MTWINYLISQSAPTPRNTGADARTRTANRPITRSVHASYLLPGAENTAPTSACCRLSWLATNGVHGQNHGQTVHSGQSALRWNVLASDPR